MNDIQLDDNRRQALSRARGIANQAAPRNGYRYAIRGISTGDVLDWPEQGLFLAVTMTTPRGLLAQGVLQDDPWGTLRDIRMAAYPLALRLTHGWLTKVRALRC